MEFKTRLNVKRIEDKEIDVAGAEETQKIRIITMESVGEKITLRGEQDKLTRFITGDYVEVRIKNTQTELFTEMELNGTKGDERRNRI